MRNEKMRSERRKENDELYETEERLQNESDAATILAKKGYGGEGRRRCEGQWRGCRISKGSDEHPPYLG
jgi:hypothetical protein